jgi:hypothetical protein
MRHYPPPAPAPLGLRRGAKEQAEFLDGALCIGGSLQPLVVDLDSEFDAATWGTGAAPLPHSFGSPKERDAVVGKRFLYTGARGVESRNRRVHSLHLGVGVSANDVVCDKRLFRIIRVTSVITFGFSKGRMVICV